MRQKFIIKNGLSNRFVISMTILMIFQVIVVLCTIVFGSTYKQLNQMSFDAFSNKVEIRSDYIRTNMLNTWGVLDNDAKKINEIVDDYLVTNSLTMQNVLNDPKSKDASIILSMISSNMSLILRKNAVTESFIILDSNTEFKSSILLRDRNPETSNNVNLDILVEIAPTNVRDKYLLEGFDNSVDYETRFNFNTLLSTDFFDKPVAEGKKTPNIDLDYLGYWSNNLRVHSSTAKQSISYTIPLILADGTVYGVLGVGISVDYLKNKFISLGDSSSDDMNLSVVFFSSEGNMEYITSNYKMQISFDKNVKHIVGSIYKTEFNKETIFMSFCEMSVYSPNTAFENETWQILGVIGKDALFQPSDTVIRQIVVTSVVVLIVGIMMVLYLGYSLTRPISSITKKIINAQNSGYEGLKLEKVKIYEIDIMIKEIEKLIKSSLAFHLKISRIIELSQIPIGAFEVKLSNNNVLMTSKFFKLFDLEYDEREITISDFQRRMDSLSQYLTDEIVNEGEYLFRVDIQDEKFILLKIVSAEDGFIGVARDITNEILEKRRLQEDRNVDVLTGLLNRRRFEEIVKSRLTEKTVKEAIMIMLDLDNLKYVNDTFGHDYGDKYIQKVSSILNGHKKDNVIISRLSGDEFMLFAHSFASKAELMSFVEELKKDLFMQYIEIYDEKLYIKLSAGVVFYDSSIKKYDDLKAYADYAMYEVKKGSKCDFKYFNKENYQSKT